MNSEYAGCRILDAPYHADREYTYYIPRELAADIMPGVFVAVPFGGGNRKKTAVVTSVSNETGLEVCKPISSVTNRGLTLTPDLLDICRFLTEHTLCTFGEAVHTVVPRGALSRVLEIFEAASGGDDGILETLSAKALLVYGFIKTKGPVNSDRLRSEFGGDDALTLASALVKCGLVTRSLDVREPTNARKTRDVSLAVTEGEARAYVEDKKNRSKRAKEIVTYLSGHGTVGIEELRSSLGDISAQLRKLSELGVVSIAERRVLRNPFSGLRKPQAPLSLSETQRAAYDELLSLYHTGEARAALLHGVTGSGKTSVIRAMIDAVTAEHRSVIILVPEISLTPQTVNIFCGSYGDRVAVIHSSLSEGERVDAWQRIRSGDADIVIGTRSAVFAPVPNLGMLVIDEEQEHTYKSDGTPKYTAHDVARFRCAKSRALLLLSSATPSLGSYYKAKTGAYTLITMKERYGGATLPRVTVADMRLDRADGNGSPLGSVLLSEIKENLDRGEQTILFLNRRGYNNFLSCKSCGKAVLCPRCSVALTYHATRRLNATDNRDDTSRRAGSSATTAATARPRRRGAPNAAAKTSSTWAGGRSASSRSSPSGSPPPAFSAWTRTRRARDRPMTRSSARSAEATRTYSSARRW